MQVQECMKHPVFSVSVNTTLAQAAKLCVEKHIGTLPVVDRQDHVVGIAMLFDLLGVVMPDFVRLMEGFDFVHDFGFLEERLPAPQTMNRPVSDVMGAAVSVEADCGLLRAFSLLNHYHLHDIPVVDSNGVLVGIASRVDIGTALLKRWNIPREVA